MFSTLIVLVNKGSFMREKGFNWGVGIFLIVYHIFIFISLPWYFMHYTPSLALILISVFLYFFAGLGITAGYHRLFSHRAYKTPRLVEGLFLFVASLAGQGSALRWSFDHRLHHAHVDTDEDPYSINKGFWYAHMLWLFEKPIPIDNKVVSDLLKSPLIRFQDRYVGSCMFFSNALVFALVGWALNDFMGAFIIALWARLFALHHSTWFINSLAHTWGDRPFCQEQSAVNNYILSFLTFGEGYHNYHHTFANDYRNGVRWFHFDPTKWLIWGLSKLQLASDLRRMDWYAINKRMVLERKNLMFERLEKIWYVKKEELQEKVDSLSEKILSELNNIRALRENYRRLKKERAEKDACIQLKEELRKLRKSMKEDWRSWRRLSRHILHLKPLEGIPAISR